MTKDSSATYYSEKYSEHYHSLSGAEEEAVKKFAEPSKENIKRICSAAHNINILDICFGLGYNSAAVIDEIRKHSKDIKINIIGLENDKEILDKIRDVYAGFDSYNLIRSAAENLFIEMDKTSIKIILSDARESVKRLDQRFDLIFLDPFSPKKCPELWTEEFFNDLRKACNENAVLTTYSCARIVRDNLVKAGFKVKDGPCVGRKSPSTLAFV